MHTYIHTRIYACITLFIISYLPKDLLMDRNAIFLHRYAGMFMYIYEYIHKIVIFLLHVLI